MYRIDFSGYSPLGCVSSRLLRQVRPTVERIVRAREFTPRNVQTTAERIKQVYGVKVRLDAKTDLRPGMAADVYFPNAPKNKI